MRIVFSLTVAIASVAGLFVTAAPADLFFQFQNNFWVNLHHVVRGDARRASLELPLAVPLDTLTPTEAAAWSHALDAYASLARHNLIFDSELVHINNLLTRLDTPTVQDAALDEVIRRALNTAAPVYRAHGWAGQQRMNEAWIASMRPRVEAHVDAVTHALAAAYHATWRRQPIIVDACAEAGPNNAYTTGGPSGTAGHTTIDVRSTRNIGDTGVEIMFHEASHTQDDQIIKTLERTRPTLPRHPGHRSRIRCHEGSSDIMRRVRGPVAPG